MGIKFTKMQAYGNDYVYIDAIHQDIQEPGRLAKKISDRHFGIGSDGLVLICNSDTCDFRMRIFNPDGTEAQMCGNALRSVARFVYDHHLTQKETVTIETLGGNQIVFLQVEDSVVKNIHAVIGQPVLQATNVPVKTELEIFLDQPIIILDKTFRASSISWGNPHTVIPVESVELLDLEKYGPAVEHADYFPERTNVTFVEVIDDTHLKIREWERGTGETIGCGTGCCSAVVVMHLLGHCARCAEVQQIGGILHVEWDERDVVHMIGPSYIVYEGEYFDEA